MTITLPVRRPVIPAELAGVQNGKLPDRLLVPCGIGNFNMAPTAARAMRALVAAAEQAGFDVRATGTYRSYAQQVKLFTDRYTTDELAGRPTKRWQGRTWWQKPGTAMAAVPGTSNHGLGLAVDLAEERDVDPDPDSVSIAFIRWLVTNAARFGVAAETQSEPWHWVYVTGDQVPAAVRAFEAGQAAPANPDTDPLEQIATSIETARRTTLRVGSHGDAVRWLQHFLTRAGHPTVVDGQFGRRTDAAVRAFQRSRRIKVDGIVGPVTWRHLLGT